MMKTISIGAALMLSVPVSAQVAQPSQMPADPTAAQPPAPANPATVSEAIAPDPRAGHAMAGSEGPVATGEQVTAETGEAGRNSAVVVSQVIDADWETYDAEGDGELTQAQFTAWMTALRARQPDAGAGSEGWAEQAFAQADADRSGTVSRDELTLFLQG